MHDLLKIQLVEIAPPVSRARRLISFTLPKALLVQVDKAVGTLDTDRSKFVRQALREYLSRKP